MDPVLSVFDDIRSVLCLCPKCEAIMRASDLHMYLRDAAPRTWLDEYEKKELGVESAEKKFDEEKARIKDEAREKGTALAKKKARECMGGGLARARFDPYDIKAILHPVEFAVFDGMKDGELKSVILASRKTGDPRMAALHKAARGAVESGRYDWKLMRVDSRGGVSVE